MAGALSPLPRQTFFANDGSPLSGGNVYTYAAGTLTPKTMYSDTALTVPISNPIVLNAAGRPVASATDATEVALYPTSGSYKWIVKNSSGSTIWTQDDIPSVAILSGTVTSVALTMPAIFSVAGSPITTSGTLAVTLATEAANTVWSGPASGSAATPTFRALTFADMLILESDVTTQFDKTTSTAYADVPGLSITLTTGKWLIEAAVYVSADATGGYKSNLQGTMTATPFVAQNLSTNNTGTPSAAVLKTSFPVADGVSAAGATTSTLYWTSTLTVTVAGTLKVQFAQSVSNGTSSVLVGSYLKGQKVA